MSSSELLLSTERIPQHGIVGTTRCIYQELFGLKAKKQLIITIITHSLRGQNLHIKFPSVCFLSRQNGQASGTKKVF